MEVQAVSKFVRLSPSKARDMARRLSGLTVAEALRETTVSERKAAFEIGKTLKSAIANAENNHNLDVDELVVAEAFVGKNLVMKRGRPRARGWFGKIVKPFSELTITVRQVEEQA